MFLTGVSVSVAGSLGIATVTFSLAIVVFVYWLIVINIGFLLMDRDNDLNWFD